MLACNHVLNTSEIVSVPVVPCLPSGLLSDVPSLRDVLPASLTSRSQCLSALLGQAWQSAEWRTMPGQPRSPRCPDPCFMALKAQLSSFVVCGESGDTNPWHLAEGNSFFLLFKFTVSWA